MVWSSSLARADEGQPVRGVVKPQLRVNYVSELGTPVARIAFREGQSFGRDAVIVAFDCRRQRAELAALEAQHREMLVGLDGNLFLARHQAAARQDVEIARAKATRTEMEAEALRVRLERCELKAPFAGRVADLSLYEHEVPRSGEPFLTIIADDDPDIELIVPSHWLSWLKLGAPFSFRIDETGAELAASVARIGAAVDAVSQTVKVFGKLAASGRSTTDVRAGMSGSARFEPTVQDARAKTSASADR